MYLKGCPKVCHCYRQTFDLKSYIKPPQNLMMQCLLKCIPESWIPVGSDCLIKVTTQSSLTNGQINERMKVIGETK